METSAGEVLRLFEHNAQAQRAFEAWREDLRRSGVHEIALGHVSRQAYEITAGQVRNLRARIKGDSIDRYPRDSSRAGQARDVDALHALGSVRAADAADEEAKNWSAPMSFNLAFHVVLERMGRLFTYPEFRRECSNDPEVLRPLLWDPATAMQVKRRRKAETYEAFLNGMRWRVGCAYYGFLKETYLLAEARERGVDARMHPLADTLFRTDVWHEGGGAVAMFIDNSEYADSKGNGRKPHMEDFVVQQLFTNVTRIALPVPTEFGTVELPSEAILDKAVRALEG